MRSVLRAVPRQRPRAVVAEGNGGISAAFRSFSVSGCSKDARRYSMSAGDGQSEVYENHPDSTSALAAPLSGIEPDDTGAKGGPSFDKKMSLKRIQYRQHQLYDTLLPEPPLQLAQHRWASDTKAAKRLAPIGADASGRRSESRRETAGAGPSVGGEISDSFRATYRSRPFRPIDLAAQKAKIQALRYLLLPDVGKSHGLHVREDGWVSLRELLRHPHFSSMDIVEFHRLLESDFGRYVDVVYDPRKLSHNDAGPSVTQPVDGWWVRLCVDVKDYEATSRQPLKRLSQRPGGLKRAFYHVNGNLRLANELKKKGIPCHEMVKLAVDRPTPPYLSRPFEKSTDIFISIDIERAQKEYRTPFFVDPSKPTELWTPGDDCGFLRPQTFDRVETIFVTSNLLWVDGLNIGGGGETGEQDISPADGEDSCFKTTKQEAIPHAPLPTLNREVICELHRSLGEELSRLQSSEDFIERWHREPLAHIEDLSPNLRATLQALPIIPPLRRKRNRIIPEPPEGIAPFWDFVTADGHL